MGVAALAAIVLVLVFVVFGGGNSEAADIEQVVNTYYESLERKDVDLYLSTWEPEKREEYEGEYAEDYLEFLPEDLDFEGMKYDIEINGDEAEVQIIEGTASYIDPYTDEKVVEDVAFVEAEPLYLVKVDGKWYITSLFFEDS